MARLESASCHHHPGISVIHEHVAAVDMGSNSFRLQVGRIVGNRIYPLDGLKETVRLAAGLDAGKQLDAASRQRALAALGRFGERLPAALPIQPGHLRLFERIAASAGERAPGPAGHLPGLSA